MKIKSKITKNNTGKSLKKKWNKYLNDYINYTKKYIKHYKKSLKGNTISLSKYPDMKLRSEILCKILSNARKKAVLSKKQTRKIHQVQMKIANFYLSKSIQYK